MKKQGERWEDKEYKRFGEWRRKGDMKVVRIKINERKKKGEGGLACEEENEEGQMEANGDKWH